MARLAKRAVGGRALPLTRPRLSDPSQTKSDFELRALVTHALADNYELGEEIGRGGMGIVYRARDRRLKRMVAVKLLPPELGYRADIRSRFMREAETSAQLSHPNIVPIYTVGEDDRIVYFIMAYVQGDNLAKLVHDRGRIPHEETRRILRDVADALAYAHARKVIHRDIKPDNILIDGESGRVLVTDFGIARAISDTAGSRLTATGMALGTPAYMSPEQAAGDREIDGRSDLYSLGIVGYQMLCGDLPFNAPNTPAMLVKHLSERPQSISERCHDLPDDLVRAVMLCLEKNPEDRFPSASSLAIALQGGPIPPSTADWAVPGRTGERAIRSATYPVSSATYPVSPAPYPMAMSPSRQPATASPTTDDLSRWNAAPVRRFRKKVIPWATTAAIMIPVGIFTGFDAAGSVVFFVGIYTAFQYSKLWSAGYDWRDVFRHPRDRLFVDFAADKIDDARALFDEKKRAQVRERERSRRVLQAAGGGTARPTSPGAATPVSPAPGEPQEVARARADRAEIHRLLDGLPENDRELVRDVGQSADALFERIESLSRAAAALDRQDVGTELTRVDHEVAELESQANPLERAASEQRVRRLAHLRRRRRSLVDLRRRRDDSRSKLESCRLALENVRLDVLRLHSGTQSYQNVTLMAEQAMQLARDVDSFVHAVDETARPAVGAR